MCKFKNGSTCRALDVDNCDETKCNFFKTEEKAHRDEQFAFDRIRLLPPHMQRYIAERYYRNKFPWLDELEKKRKAKTKGVNK